MQRADAGRRDGALEWQTAVVGGSSAIDERTTRQAGYEISQKKRKRIEECFGWLKDIALLPRVRHRGIHKVGWVFTLAAAAYNQVRMRKLLSTPVCASGVRAGVCPKAAKNGKTSRRYKKLVPPKAV